MHGDAYTGTTLLASFVFTPGWFFDLFPMWVKQSGPVQSNCEIIKKNQVMVHAYVRKIKVGFYFIYIFPFRGDNNIIYMAQKILTLTSPKKL